MQFINSPDSRRSHRSPAKIRRPPGAEEHQYMVKACSYLSGQHFSNTGSCTFVYWVLVTVDGPMWSPLWQPPHMVRFHVWESLKHDGWASIQNIEFVWAWPSAKQVTAGYLKYAWDSNKQEQSLANHLTPCSVL